MFINVISLLQEPAFSYSISFCLVLVSGCLLSPSYSISTRGRGPSMCVITIDLHPFLIKSENKFTHRPHIQTHTLMNINLNNYPHHGKCFFSVQLKPLILIPITPVSLYLTCPGQLNLIPHFATSLFICHQNTHSLMSFV